MKVSVNAVEKRLRRALAQESLMLRKNRRFSSNLGDAGEYIVVNERNFVEQTHCSLDDLAEDYSVLRPGEEIAGG